LKATLTFEFDTPAALHAFVDRMRGKDAAVALAYSPSEILLRGDVKGEAVIPHADEPQRTRKPRADAGKPRGPYKKGDTTTGEPAASEPGVQGAGIPASPQPEALATPTTTASPDARVAEQRTVNPPEAGANPVGGPTLTLEDAKAALRRVKDTKGLGTPACIGLIQSFGFDKISDLPAAQFAEFIRVADERIKKHQSEGGAK
jgi:hypothetical protein